MISAYNKIGLGFPGRRWVSVKPRPFVLGEDFVSPSFDGFRWRPAKFPLDDIVRTIGLVGLKEFASNGC